LTELALKWQGPQAVPDPVHPPKAQSPETFWPLARKLTQSAGGGGAGGGGPEAFWHQAHQLEPFLYATALRLCRNPADARDLVQDTFECGLRDHGRLRSNSNVRGWLVTILYNRFMDRCRARAQEPQRTAIEEVAESYPAEEAPPEEAWERVTFTELLNALEELEEPFKQVYQLGAIERRPYKEIAERLGIPLATVGTRLMRARGKLKSLLLREEAEGEE
jgi:RNA polymerase sigma-70 factor, ECF subfamily